MSELISKVSNDNKLNVLEKMLEELGKKKNYSAVGQPAIVLLGQLMKTINFSAKKSIIKPFFTKNFLPILEKNFQFMYLFLAFMSAITDKSVYSVTIGKSFKNNVETKPLVQNKIAQQFLYLILSKELQNIGSIDKRLFLNPALAEFMNLEEMTKEHVFKENLSFLTQSILSKFEILPTPGQVMEFASEDQHFSSLIGAIIERMCQGEIKR